MNFSKVLNGKEQKNKSVNFYSLIKLLYVEGLDSSSFRYIYKNSCYFFRYCDSCFKANVKEGSSVDEIIDVLCDCTNQYNEIKLSDDRYIDGFIFPEELEDDFDDDNYCCCIAEIEDGYIIWKNRLGLKINISDINKTGLLKNIFSIC